MSYQEESLIGSPVTSLPTPAFLVSKRRVENNCARMLQKCKDLNISLRAQTKTHKTIEGALIQTNGRKQGIVVSTLKEAELYVDNGFDDILFGFPLMQHHIKRCKIIMTKIENFHVMVNSDEGITVLEKNNFEDKPWSVFLKISTGYERAGIPWTDTKKIRQLYQRIETLGYKFKGLYVHCGNSYTAKDVEKVRNESVDRLLSLSDELGICEELIIGIGSTPSCSHEISSKLSQLNEIHPGNYIFYDCQQESYGSCTTEDIAVRVMTRVVSHHIESNYLLVDLGFTGFTKQGQDLLKKPGFGKIQNEHNLMLMNMTQELGKVTTIDGSELDFLHYPVGTIFYLYPYHACATAGMYSEYYVHDDKGIIVEIWKPVRGW